MSACLDYDDFAALLDGVLADNERKVAAAHIVKCATCRALAAELGYEIPPDPALVATALAPQNSNPALQHTVDASDSYRPAHQAQGAKDGDGTDAAIVHVPSEPILGQVIHGYRVQREIGRGGMGAVYEAVHERLGQRVAIKVMFPEYSRDPEFMRRFRAEARAASIVRHPGLVTIFNHGQLPGGMAFIMMEFLQGESLRSRMLRGKLPQQELLRFCRQISSALCAVHENGITHRDLKPENVMIVPDGDVEMGQRTKVVDFGIAKTGSMTSRSDASGTGPQVFLGTVAYASPEQCQMSSHVDGKADVYSFGVMIYELLSGELPFSGTVTEVIGAHIRDVPPPLQNLSTDVPAELRDLVHAMLAKLPGHRPRMQDVRDRLDQLIKPEQTTPTKRPIAWSAVTLSLAAALGALLYFLLR
jgi:serine/threonine protein kinase